MKKINIRNLKEIKSAEADSLQKILDRLFFAGTDVKTVLFAGVDETDARDTTLNLARILTKGGKRVLLLDMNIGRDDVSLALDDQDAGVTHYLAGRCELKDIFYETNVPSLSVVPAGAGTINPELVLIPDRLKALADACKQDYDWVLIYGTAINRQNTQALSYAPLSDGAVLIAKHKITHKADLTWAKNALNKADCSVLGCVVLDVKNPADYN